MYYCVICTVSIACRALPSPSIPTPTSVDRRELINFLQEDEEIKLTEEHVSLQPAMELRHEK